MDKSPFLPRLAFTPGEPAGIGPDLAIMLAQRELPLQLVALTSPTLLMQRAELLGLPLELLPPPQERTQPHRPGTLCVEPVQLAAPVQAGQLDPANGDYVLATLRRAVVGCLSGEYDALVTGPVHKGVINDAGHPFTGHTEYLSELCGGALPVMMLTAQTLRVALVTTHLPLAAVPGAVTRELLEEIIRILYRDLVRRFGIANPRILVCGLNPHAGEGGHLGREEIEVIEPVLGKLRAEGMRLEGPLPADTLFAPHRLAGADAVLAMYHDQGLPVLKHLGFGQAVNITLGLPIIRTSVDHGTALDLAGKGMASTGSLLAAIDTALEMVRPTR